MYKIIRNGRRFGNKSFSSYDKARSYARKALRKILNVSIHPALKINGFSIAKI